jgi:hypothetical protein
MPTPVLKQTLSQQWMGKNIQYPLIASLVIIRKLLLK